MRAERCGGKWHIPWKSVVVSTYDPTDGLEPVPGSSVVRFSRLRLSTVRSDRHPEQLIPPIRRWRRNCQLTAQQQQQTHTDNNAPRLTGHIVFRLCLFP